MPRSGRQVLAAVCVAVVTLSCSPAWRNAERARSQPSQTYLAQFDELWSRFDAVYPSFDVKGVDWKAQRALYRPRAARARSQSEFVAITSKMLEPLRDLHVWFIDPRGQVVPTFRPSGVPNFDEARWKRALRDVGYVSRSNDFGEANVGGYGYLFIGTWRGNNDVAALDLALARARELPGLIVDVRTNGGGDDATALAFASRFTATSFAASYIQTRNGPAHEQLEPLTARTIAPRGSWQFLKPVVVIAGRGGFSATESFVAALRTLPNVTVIGDTTGGASGNPATFALGGGWSYTVPQWIEYGPDHGPIEWHGVAPHVVMPWSPSAYDRDRDPLIDAAVGVLAERNGVFRVAPSGKDAAPPARSNAAPSNAARSNAAPSRTRSRTSARQSPSAWP